MTGKPAKLRKLLAADGMVVAPFVFDALTAMIAERVGFDALYMTGHGTSASLGMPDVGLVTMTEMVNNIRYIAAATSVPLIADADTAYGNPMNVQRTVREYERAGAAALHMEDQVFPKKCGFLEGKQLISLEENVQKIHAALDARLDPDFVIIARTDALAVSGWEDTIRRALAYRDAGADLIFVDGIRTREDLRAYAENLAQKGIPCLYNGWVVPTPEAGQLGFKITITGSSQRLAYLALCESLEKLKQTGVSDYKLRPSGIDFPSLTDLLGLPAVYDTEQRYAVKAPTEAPQRTEHTRPS
ncbi:MAG: isocitrate lyase/PEP mutase family protein [Chloroflexi bacterium]|nr:isocitrate lyase/PEP mutase family protein [Chloroflexota bacterium]